MTAVTEGAFARLPAPKRREGGFEGKQPAGPQAETLNSRRRVGPNASFRRPQSSAGERIMQLAAKITF